MPYLQICATKMPYLPIFATKMPYSHIFGSKIFGSISGKLLLDRSPPPTCHFFLAKSGKLLLDRSPPPACHFFLAKSEQGAQICDNMFDQRIYVHFQVLFCYNFVSSGQRIILCLIDLVLYSKQQCDLLQKQTTNFSNKSPLITNYTFIS